MKTASKLAQLARANQNKQEKVQLTKDGKVVFIGTRESAERWMCENGGTYSVEKWKPQSFQKKVSWASHHYVRFVKQRCKELASKGYGSVEIKIDKTTDMFCVDEGRGSTYSHDFVVKLLQQEGFQLEELEDHFDAQSYILYWQVKPDFSHASNTCLAEDEALLRAEKEWGRNKLPQAPDSEKIGMCWK